jgi:hypothetical protein
MRRSEDCPGERLGRLTSSCEEKCIKIMELKQRAASLESMIQESEDAELEETLTRLRLELATVRSSISNTLLRFILMSTGFTKKKKEEESRLHDILLQGVWVPIVFLPFSSFHLSQRSELLLGDIDSNIIEMVDSWCEGACLIVTNNRLAGCRAGNHKLRASAEDPAISLYRSKRKCS